MIEQFYLKLKESIEDNSELLKKGDLFLPEYLTVNGFITKFKKVMHTLEKKINLKVDTEVTKKFLPFYKCGLSGRIDYVFKDKKNDKIYLEVESLDMAQPFSFLNYPKKDSYFKFEHYYGEIGNYLRGEKIAQYYIFFLVLPNSKVSRYALHDLELFFRPSIKKVIREVIFQNPFEICYPMIRTYASIYINKEQRFKKNNNIIHKKLFDFQEKCELILITCTGNELLLSRGKDKFDPKKQTKVNINWR